MYIVWFITVKKDIWKHSHIVYAYFLFLLFSFQEETKNPMLLQNKKPVGSTKPRKLSQNSFEYERRNPVWTPVKWKAHHCRCLSGTRNTSAIKHTYILYTTLIFLFNISPQAVACRSGVWESYGPAQYGSKATETKGFTGFGRTTNSNINNEWEEKRLIGRTIDKD